MKYPDEKRRMLCEDTRRTKICAFGRNDRFSARDMQCKSLDETVCAGYRNTEPVFSGTI